MGDVSSKGGGRLGERTCFWLTEDVIYQRGARCWNDGGGGDDNDGDVGVSGSSEIGGSVGNGDVDSNGDDGRFGNEKQQCQ